MVKTPTILLRAELALSAIALLSALAFAVVALRGEHYFMLASEGLILMAGVFGVLAGLGRFATGPALAATCVAGSIFTGAVIGGFETQALPRFAGETPANAAAASRIALAALIAAVGALMIISRTPAESTRRLVLAGVAFAPVAALAVAWRTGLIARMQEALPEIAFQVAALGAGLLVIIFVSIAAHCAIRAFEIGVEAAESASENAKA